MHHCRRRRRRSEAMTAATAAAALVVLLLGAASVAADTVEPASVAADTVEPASLKPASPASDSGFFCDSGATEYCDLLMSANDLTKAVVAADGYIFVMLSSGVMRRCQQGVPNSCVRWNSIKSGGGPMILLRPGVLIATSGNDMVSCRTDTADRCTLINQCAGSTSYRSLIYANGRLYAGLSSGTMWSCDPDRVNSCQDLNKAGSAITSLAYGDDVLWAGIDSGTLWRCDPNKKDSCRDYNKAGSGVRSLVLADSSLFAGLASGTQWKCALNRPDSCSDHNRLGSGLWVMTQLPNEASVIYVGTSGGVYRCPTATRDSCATVATSKKGSIAAIAPVASATASTLYVGYGQTYCYEYNCVESSWVSWAETDRCPDRTVVSINSAVPITPKDPIPSNIKSSANTATFTGTAINRQNVQQTVSFAVTVTRSITATVTWQKAVKNAWKVDVKNPFAIFTPIAPEITAGYSGEIQTTDGKSDAIANTVANAYTIALAVPPHNNCSVGGTVTTATQSWTQDYEVNVTYACGTTGIETWAADLVVTDVLTTQSQYLVEYKPCAVIPLPPITDTCSSNPGCAAFSELGKCCPLENGTYLACCAQAAAHTPTPCVQGVDFTFPSQNICPSTDWSYKACCPPATQPTYAVSDIGLVKVASAEAQAVCGSNNASDVAEAYDAGMAVGDAGMRVCVRAEPITSPTVPVAGKFVSDVHVVTGKPFAQLTCRPGFTKVKTSIYKRSSGNAVAVCVKRAAAGTPVAQLLGGVFVDDKCTAEGRELPSGLKKVPGNLNSHFSNASPAHLCTHSARALKP